MATQASGERHILAPGGQQQANVGREPPEDDSEPARDQTTSQQQSPELPLSGQFEDDEDLYRMKQLQQQQQQQQQSSGEFISEADPQKPSSQTNDDEDYGPAAKGSSSSQQPPAAIQSEPAEASIGEPNNESSPLMTPRGSNEKSSPPTRHSIDGNNTSYASDNYHEHHRDAGADQGHDRRRGKNWPRDSRDSNLIDSSNESRDSEPQSTSSNYLNNPFDSTRSRLAKFVHKIAPELGCYTGVGEHYRGNASKSSDGRNCVNWSLVRLSLLNGQGMTKNRLISASLAASQQQPLAMDADHNYCRNSNLDLRGPWCYVDYIEGLDKLGEQTHNQLLGLRLPNPRSFAAVDAQGLPRYVPRQCALAPCSEYLWLYIVAPPVGLLVLLLCLATVLVRSIGKSHYKSIFAQGKRRSLPKFNKLLSARNRFAAARRFGSGAKKPIGNYLDDDIFEIVNDIDWSDGQTQSMSPKSTESLKLNSSFSYSSNNTDVDSQRLNSSALGGHGSRFILNDNSPSSEKSSPQLTSCAMDLLSGSQITKRPEVSVGPMFATLRCHVRRPGNCNNSNSNLNGSQQVTGQATGKGLAGNCPKQQSINSSSAFIEQYDPLNENQCLSSNSNNNSRASASQFKGTASQPANGKQRHPIPCSSTTNFGDTNTNCTTPEFDCKSGAEVSIAADGEKYIAGMELPQLDASSVSIALNQQPIYEGKFSQVLVAHIRPSKQQDGSQLEPSIGHIGTQVALCALKPTAAIDPKVFAPANLRLRNLNHLNIIKLIGYAQVSLDGSTNAASGLATEIGGLHSESLNHQEADDNLTATCSLVYDMAQLVDLSDWLKQQSQDTLTSNRPGDDQSVQRNLTCFSKQIALALDYLHDRGIVYKDLACRNCFLDVTKMLVKLASFNIELIIDEPSDSREMSLKSMIRPKHLLDYYVIDSRPTECQLLPLSWIPLESILFNKFNKQTDIWSFGCLLYELFSLGEVAYFGYSSKQVIDSVRSNLMPPQPLLCPNGIYKLMRNCLSDIPTLRPTIKQIYEQLNLYSGQCSSFLDHHLCSLAAATSKHEDRHLKTSNGSKCLALDGTKGSQLGVNGLRGLPVQGTSSSGSCSRNSSITKTKSYANIRNFSSPSQASTNKAGNDLFSSFGYDNSNLVSVKQQLQGRVSKQDSPAPEIVAKIPMSKSINLGASRLLNNSKEHNNNADDVNQYDEPIVELKDRSR